MITGELKSQNQWQYLTKGDV